MSAFITAGEAHPAGIARVMIQREFILYPLHALLIAHVSFALSKAASLAICARNLMLFRHEPQSAVLNHLSLLQRGH